MIGRLALVLGLGIVGVGCNQVFDLDKTVPAPGGDGGNAAGDGGLLIDLDLDGIPDDQDPCLAAAMDATQDEDMDGIANAADPCPLDDTTQSPLDGDGDQIPDTCDPFPATGGDTKRCTMTFNNTDLNLRLWHESDALMKWGTMQGNLHTIDGQGMTNVVSAIRLDGSAQPSYDVDLIANGDSESGPTDIWIRRSIPRGNAVPTSVCAPKSRPSPSTTATRTELVSPEISHPTSSFVCGSAARAHSRTVWNTAASPFAVSSTS